MRFMRISYFKSAGSMNFGDYAILSFLFSLLQIQAFHEFVNSIEESVFLKKELKK